MKFVSKYVLLIVISTIFILSGCSAGSNEQSSKESSDYGSMENKSEKSEDSSAFTEGEETNTNNTGQAPIENRMVIYTANLSVQVKDFKKSQTLLEQKAKDFGGYIVQSNVYNNGDNTMSGSMTFRIPQSNFTLFLNETETVALKVLERNVSGEDVTEEFVDLESRLKSKRAVEERLITFMKDAKKTDDLLKISSDLSKVQEEIEQIVGRVKYLKNRTDLSTVTISLHENKVIVPGIEENQLNTVDRTKKQLVDSTNALLSLFSNLVVFLIGNLPFFIILAFILFPLYFYMKRKRRVQKPTGTKTNDNKD